MCLASATVTVKISDDTFLNKNLSMSVSGKKTLSKMCHKTNLNKKHLISQITWRSFRTAVLSAIFLKRELNPHQRMYLELQECAAECKLHSWNISRRSTEMRNEIFGRKKTTTWFYISCFPIISHKDGARFWLWTWNQSAAAFMIKAV